MGRFDDWAPAVETRHEIERVDMRGAATGPKGYKINPIKTSRKRKLGEEPEVEQVAAAAMDTDGGGASAAAAEPPAAAAAAKRRRVEGEPLRSVRELCLLALQGPAAVYGCLCPPRPGACAQPSPRAPHPRPPALQ